MATATIYQTVEMRVMRLWAENFARFGRIVQNGEWSVYWVDSIGSGPKRVISVPRVMNGSVPRREREVNERTPPSPTMRPPLQ